MTFDQLFSAVEANVWPEGHARKVRARANDWLRDVLIDLQRKVPQLKAGHINYLPQASTFYKCGITAFEAPLGPVTKLAVRSIVGNCCEVVCRPVARQEIEQQTRYCFTGCTTPAPVNPNPAGPFGLLIPDSTIDHKFRQDPRKASLFNGYIWLWTHINSTEEVVMEWSGSKRNWQGGDSFSRHWLDESGGFSREIQRIIELYVNAMRIWWDCNNRQTVVADLGAYAEAVAGLILDRRRDDSLSNIVPPIFQ